MAPPPSQQSSSSQKDQKASERKQQRRKAGTGLNDLFIGVFGVGFLLSLSLNLLHANIDDATFATGTNTALHQAVRDFKQPRRGRSREQLQLRLKEEDRPEEHLANVDSNANANADTDTDTDGLLVPMELHLDKDEGGINLAELHCDAFGGPSKEIAQEMVYWEDIPSDAHWSSPFRHPDETKYLTFEPDGGGWNNIRMAMESVIALALAMGRTLVMPPQKKMYLLGKSDNAQQKHFSFVDFFPIHEMAQEHEGLDVITMEEYLQKEAMTGKLTNKITGKVELPPGNRTDWDGIDQHDYDALREYLRNVSNTPLWKPGQCLPAFPQSGDHKDVAMLQQMAHETHKDPPEGRAVNVDHPDPLLRLEESLAGRKQLCVYDEELQQAPVLHFMCNHKMKIRMLVHFYAFLFFEDWKEDLWMKRFVRDHVRYIDEIQCAAARVVQAVREHSRNNNNQGDFDSMHVRRGDFQFKTTRISAEEIYQNSKDQFTPNTTIFIATDEREKKFFDPLRQHYNLLFLDDFKKELQGVNTNYYGMIDQLVASRGRIFFGCWFSTFTGYITRIRGYHSQKDRAPGYEQGTLPTTYYYATLDKKFKLHKYSPLRGGFFNREFPTSWRDINKGIGAMHKS